MYLALFSLDSPVCSEGMVKETQELTCLWLSGPVLPCHEWIHWHRTVSSSMVLFCVILCAWSSAMEVLVAGDLGMRDSFKSPYLLSLYIMSSATYILIEHGLLVPFLVL